MSNIVNDIDRNMFFKRKERSRIKHKSDTKAALVVLLALSKYIL